MLLRERKTAWGGVSAGGKTEEGQDGGVRDRGRETWRTKTRALRRQGRAHDSRESGKGSRANRDAERDTIKLGAIRGRKGERAVEHRRERSCQGGESCTRCCRVRETLENERDALGGGSPAGCVEVKREGVDGGE